MGKCIIQLGNGNLEQQINGVLGENLFQHNAFDQGSDLNCFNDQNDFQTPIPIYQLSAFRRDQNHSTNSNQDPFDERFLKIADKIDRANQSISSFAKEI